ncbi:HOOK-domain-containing protein [Schizophyllum amplum]|uniref:HOOK-domain-containing protein n=1 Tax=Schizophyllum amplum TaxID=97359 RepID=A0A550C3P4_9AGAR|nr:HOOK-domain-containing protein [Auriculariopsis ampla]
MPPRDQQKETDAFFHFFTSFDLSRPVTSTADLADGSILFEVLAAVDETYFQRRTSQTGSQDNWVLRFTSLKSLYKLMTQYFTDVLRKPTKNLEAPNLQAVAKDYSTPDALILCRMAIAIGVQCERNKDFIAKIQSLSEADQHNLMRAIESVIKKLGEGVDEETGEMTEDDHYYRIQSEKSQILAEKDTLQTAYQKLLDDQRDLQTQLDDAQAEKADAAEYKRNEKGDVMLRAELDRLRTELQKSEDNYAATEHELDKQQQGRYRHAADRLQKTENVMEKYKKKLQEGADLRQHVKALEKQNADLVDKNASLEEEYRKVAGFKPLMESYKNQIADLEGKGSSRTQEIESLRFELDQTRTKLKIATEERAKDSETLELYQERVRELELQSHRPVAKRKASDAAPPGAPEPGASVSEELQPHLEDEDDVDQGLGGELDDAITGTTMTDLKLQVKKLKRELESVRRNESDASRVLVLENLLEDANRMKGRYEQDYLAAHREKLILQRDLEEIRSGKSMGDGAEAAIALRQRLNEVVEQLEALRKEHAELEVKFDTQAKELTIAKSDLNLVNKDQLDILATLRESVNEDKTGLEVELDKLRNHNKELADKNRMQLEQVNALLLEKISMQGEGISQRERMLQRERDFADMRAVISGKDLPEDVKQQMIALHEENANLKDSYKTAQDKLLKARAFIKSQDKLFKEEHAKGLSSGLSSEAETKIKMLEDDVARMKRRMLEIQKTYRREQELMISAQHVLGMQITRHHLGSSQQSSRTPLSGFLNQQRGRAAQMLPMVR